MKKFVFIVAILAFFSGCSSSKVENNAADLAIIPNASPANANTTAATNSNPTGMQPYNGMQNINPTAFNATNNNLKVVPYQPKKDELPYGSRVAPDDSIISSGSRGKDFLETRTFKNHPVLDKVEKIMDGKTVRYKVYLKNGKVIEAPAEKMSNMEALAPGNILDAIGMSPKPETNPQPKPEEKKQQKQ